MNAAKTRKLGCALASLLLLIACGGPFADAMKRGDSYFAARSWDDAALAYEKALSLDPTDKEANQKFRLAQAERLADRLEKAKAADEKGDFTSAFRLYEQARTIQPDNTTAVEGSTRTLDAICISADRALADGKAQEAYELLQVVLTVRKNEPRALELSSRAARTISDQALSLGSALFGQGHRGAALLEYARAVAYTPSLAEAQERLTSTRRRVLEDSAFVVRIGRFGHDPTTEDFSNSVTPLGMKQKLGAGLNIAFQADTKGGQGGLSVSGQFHSYQSGHAQTFVTRTCQYVCGTEYIANRAHQDQARLVDQLQASIEVAKLDIKRFESERERLLRERTSLERQRSKLQGSARGANYAADVDVINQKLEETDVHIKTVTENVNKARTYYQSLESELLRALERLRSIPDRVPVEKTCAHSYAVEVHSFTANVSLRLARTDLKGAPLSDDEDYAFSYRKEDEAFAPQAAKCAELASGDPLVVPPENDQKYSLLDQGLTQIARRIGDGYQHHVTEFLNQAREQARKGDTLFAVDSYVQYLLMDTSAASPDRRAAEQSLIQLKPTSPAVLALAMSARP